MIHQPIDQASAEPAAFLTLPRLRPLPNPDHLPDRIGGASSPAQTSTLLSARGDDVAGAGSPGCLPAPATDLDPLTLSLSQGAIGEIARLRCEQVEKWGHTPEKDVALPLDHLPREARETIAAAVEDLQFHRSGPALATARVRIRKRMLKAAALIAAAVDRLDLEPEDNGDWPEF